MAAAEAGKQQPVVSSAAMEVVAGVQPTTAAEARPMAAAEAPAPAQAAEAAELRAEAGEQAGLEQQGQEQQGQEGEAAAPAPAEAAQALQRNREALGEEMCAFAAAAGPGEVEREARAEALAAVEAAAAAVLGANPRLQASGVERAGLERRAGPLAHLAISRQPTELPRKPFIPGSWPPPHTHTTPPTPHPPTHTSPPLLPCASRCVPLAPRSTAWASPAASWTCRCVA